jgi:uncharacterized protein DUF4340
VVEATVRRAWLRSRLLAVWLVLLALIAAIAAIEYTGTPGVAQDQWLLPLALEEIGAIELGRGGKLHRYERDSAGAWFYHGGHAASEIDHVHRADPERAKRIGEAFAAFGRTRIERRLALDAQATQYGLSAPGMVILLYREKAGQPLAQYAVGDLAPDTFSRYVLKVDATEVVTIPGYQIDNLVALIDATAETPRR